LRHGQASGVVDKSPVIRLRNRRKKRNGVADQNASRRTMPGQTYVTKPPLGGGFPPLRHGTSIGAVVTIVPLSELADP
jgi:hypothetical protein